MRDDYDNEERENLDIEEKMERREFTNRRKIEEGIKEGEGNIGKKYHIYRKLKNKYEKYAHGYLYIY